MGINSSFYECQASSPMDTNRVLVPAAAMCNGLPDCLSGDDETNFLCAGEYFPVYHDNFDAPHNYVFAMGFLCCCSCALFLMLTNCR